MAEAIKQKSKVWWLWLILGILVTVLGATLFGNLAFTFVLAELLAGIFFLVAGIGGAIVTIADRKFISLWGLKLVLEILVVIAGIFMLTRPAFAASFIWFICGFGFLFNGISLIMLSLSIKKLNQGAGWVAILIFGIIILLAAFGILANPILGLVFVNICIAIDVLFFGISTIVYAIQVK
ncbi:MAG: DUF308 domain-containing protein [Coriobacteriia bacterium]|nr:DUF308 domain-containing protein [Coriobacteriia bacterium]